MKYKDIALESFLNMRLDQLVRVPIIAVYDNPKDYPAKFVARLWDIRNKPTKYIIVKDSLEEIRNLIPKTFHRLPPPADDPVIVETYI